MIKNIRFVFIILFCVCVCSYTLLLMKPKGTKIHCYWKNCDSGDIDLSYASLDKLPWCILSRIVTTDASFLPVHIFLLSTPDGGNYSQYPRGNDVLTFSTYLELISKSTTLHGGIREMLSFSLHIITTDNIKTCFCNLSH